MNKISYIFHQFVDSSRIQYLLTLVVTIFIVKIQLDSWKFAKISVITAICIFEKKKILYIWGFPAQIDLAVNTIFNFFFT